MVLLRITGGLRRFTQGLIAGYADYLHERATQLREEVAREHLALMPLLMAKCDHKLRIRNPYAPPSEAGAIPRDHCPRCAGLDSVPGALGAQLVLKVQLANLYDAVSTRPYEGR